MNLLKSPKELLDKTESDLKKGDLKSAKATLEKIRAAELVNTQSATYARLCWRSGQAELGLRYLSPLLKNKSFRSSSGDWAEYAMCLNAIGASSEAQAVLKTKCGADPAFNTYMGFSLIYEWDYLAAIPFLEKAVQQKDLSPYQVAVAQVNLLGAYIAEDLIPQALPLHLELAQNLSAAYTRLHHNLKELSLQLLVAQKKYDQALAALKTEFKTAPTEGPEVFYYKKWKTIVEVEMGLQDLPSLIKLGHEARQSERWEIARDCETRVAFKTLNPVFLKRVYYATPWPAYRKRISSQFKKDLDLEGPFEFWLTPVEHPESSLTKTYSQMKYKLDIENGDLGALKIKKGSLPHRLLRALSSDLFRPHPVGGLFHRLFENEKYDMESSPTRIYRAVNELREILVEAQVPLEIVPHSQGYYLRCHEPLCLVLPSDRGANKSLIRLKPLQAFGAQEFSAKDVAQALEVSLKTAQRLLNEGQACGHITRSGEGAATRYKWSK